MSRWTERRIDPVRMIKSQYIQSDPNDDSEEEGTPGAYRISRDTRQDSLIDEWDPTEQVGVDALAMPDASDSTSEFHPDMNHHDRPNNHDGVTSSRSLYLADDTQALTNDTAFLSIASASDADFAQVSKPAKEPRGRRKRVGFFVAALILFFVLCAVVGTIVFSTGTQKARNDDIPLWSRNCRFSDQAMLSQMEVNPFLQCQYCFGHVQSIREGVTGVYKYLQASELFRDHVDNGTMITSCDPQNVALLWTAQDLLMENLQIDLGLEPVMHTLTRFVLVFLYASLSGEYWDRATNWLTNTSECNWYGITCDEQASVTSLELPHNNVTGLLDEKLGLLTELRALDLDTNRLTGPIPSALWTLPLLEDVKLDNNDLKETPLFTSMAFPSNLKMLSLQHNENLKGTLQDISLMTQLVELDLSWTALTGIIPSSIGLLTNLKKFVLTRTSLVGTIPTTLGRMTSLEDLRIDYVYGSLSGTIPSTIGNLTNLAYFGVSDNSIEGSIPSEIGRCSQLVEFNILRNHLSGTIPTEMANCQQLERLDFRQNRLVSTIPPEFERLLNLQELKMTCNSIIGPVPAGICNPFTRIEVYGSDLSCSCCEVMEGDTCGGY